MFAKFFGELQINKLDIHQKFVRKTVLPSFLKEKTDIFKKRQKVELFKIIEWQI